MNLPNWTREPLVHFLFFGAIMYIALTWGGTPPDPASRVIKVGASEKEKIAESWALKMGRSPNDEELDLAIDAYVREEVLYREALRLGLDESDSIVRRRLVSKMDLSASLAAETTEPSDKMLRAYLEENAELYQDHRAAQAKLSFDQIFFSSEAAARSALVDNSGAGETTSLPPSIEATPMRDVEARFGSQFAKELSVLQPAESWQGPLASGFGWHLIRLRDRVTQPSDFEELRSVLINDWRRAQINGRKDRAYEMLRSAYRIDVDR